MAAAAERGAPSSLVPAPIRRRSGVTDGVLSRPRRHPAGDEVGSKSNRAASVAAGEMIRRNMAVAARGRGNNQPIAGLCDGSVFVSVTMLFLAVVQMTVGTRGVVVRPGTGPEDQIPVQTF